MQRYVYSDPHFGHSGMTRFTTADGSKMRPWDSLEEMHEALVDNWNSVVTKHDRVLIIGDVVWDLATLPILKRLRGTKTLIRGNHDVYPARTYLEYFEDVLGVWKKDRRLFSHYPVHPDCISYTVKQNVHGHLHEKVVLTPEGQPDARYVNVCVERTNYTPLSWDLLPETE